MAPPLHFKKRICDFFQTSEATPGNEEAQQPPSQAYSSVSDNQELQRVTYRVSYAGNGEVVLDKKGHLLMTFSYPLDPTMYLPHGVQHIPRYLEDNGWKQQEDSPLDLTVSTSQSGTRLPCSSISPLQTSTPPPSPSLPKPHPTGTDTPPTVSPSTTPRTLHTMLTPEFDATHSQHSGKILSSDIPVQKTKKLKMQVKENCKEDVNEGGGSNHDVVMRVQPGRRTKGINPWRQQHGDWSLLDAAEMEEQHEELVPAINRTKYRRLKTSLEGTIVDTDTHGKGVTRKSREAAYITIMDFNCKDEFFEEDLEKDSDYVIPELTNASFFC